MIQAVFERGRRWRGSAEITGHAEAVNTALMSCVHRFDSSH